MPQPENRLPADAQDSLTLPAATLKSRPRLPVALTGSDAPREAAASNCQ